MPYSALPEPMLARSGRLPARGAWAYGIKWDGSARSSRRKATCASAAGAVDFDVEPARQAIYIALANTGRTIARNVKVTFEPDLESSLDLRGTTGPIRDLKPLSAGIGTLAPGKRVKVLSDIFTQREEGTFPDVYLARARFDAPAVRKQGLEETYELDVGLYRNVLHVVRADVHDVNTQLEKLVKAVERLSG